MQQASVRGILVAWLQQISPLQVEAFIFDCDGVIWRGDSLIDGVPETLDMLRSMGKKLIFVTNNSTKSRKGYQSKFTKLGLKVSPEEIYSSSFAAAAYLDSTKFPKDQKIYVVGEVGIQEELDLLGFQHIGGPEDAGKVRASFAPQRTNLHHLLADLLCYANLLRCKAHNQVHSFFFHACVSSVSSGCIPWTLGETPHLGLASGTGMNM